MSKGDALKVNKDEKLYVGLEFVVGKTHAERFDYENLIGRKAVIITVSHPSSSDFVIARVGKEKRNIRKEDITVEHNQ